MCIILVYFMTRNQSKRTEGEGVISCKLPMIEVEGLIMSVSMTYSSLRMEHQGATQVGYVPSGLIHHPVRKLVLYFARNDEKFVFIAVLMSEIYTFIICPCTKPEISIAIPCTV